MCQRDTVEMLNVSKGGLMKCIETAQLRNFLSFNKLKFYSSNFLIRKILKTTKLTASFMVAILIFTGCDDSVATKNNGYYTGTTDLLLVVEDRIYTSIKTNLDAYINALSKKNHNVIAIQYKGGTVKELRSLLKDYYTKHNIKGAFLIGNLPAAWYKKRTYNKYNEEFPFDVYLMDFDDIWIDSNGDGMFDNHHAIETEIFVSRLKGSVGEINGYLEKVVDYKKGGSLVRKGAFIFKDDDWRNFNYNNMFGLDSTYEEVNLYQSLDETTRLKYIDYLTITGAEYVYQWIHSSSSGLYIHGYYGSERVGLDDIKKYNFKGSFYNLFDCSAARFVQSNLAMTYLINTDYGLATLGSTKIGGNWEPQVFHQELASGKTWGEAYRKWYNSKGVKRDDWYLGMVIFGDPTLLVSQTLKQKFRSIQGSSIEVIVDNKELLQREYEDSTGDYSKYKNDNPQFFSK